MRKLLFVLCACVLVAAVTAQTRKPAATRKPATTAVQPKKNAASQPKKTTAARQKRPAAQPKKNAASQQKKPAYTNSSIKGLQNERAALQKKIKEQEQLLRANRADVKKRLDNLMAINTEIEQHQKTIADIQRDIQHLDGNIDLLKAQLNTLEAQLNERKDKYVKSLRYMARNRNIQDQLMFIFSAKSLTQMYRRLRFVREYAAYQRAQGELVKTKQQQIASKHEELERVKKEKNSLLYKGKQAQTALEGKKDEQQQVVNTLQKQQKTIQGIIDEQRKKDQELNAQIDRLIAEEVAKARIRAAEEARRKAAEEAAAKKRREEALARKKAEAEAAAKENARRIEEARKREEKAKAAARAAAKGNNSAKKERTEMEARQAQADREAAERKAAVDSRRHESEVAAARRETTEGSLVSSIDRKLSSHFENNKGRLPIPVTGGYSIVRHYGQYSVEGLRGVTLDNKGVNIRAAAGAQARCIFDGEVSRVYNFGNSWIVMVRHGSYISVYFNLRSVNVSQGQHVGTRQALGLLGDDHILKFQLRRGNTILNPEVWLGR